MSLFCCGKIDKNKISPPASPQKAPPVRIAPKLARRRSAPRPRASKQNIEEFYREGKELLRAEQEDNERARLRAALRREYERDVYEEGTIDSRIPPGFEEISTNNERTSSGPSYSRDEANASSSRRYSFETATDKVKRSGDSEDFFMTPYESLSKFSRKTQNLKAVDQGMDSLNSSLEVLESQAEEGVSQNEKFLPALKPHQTLSKNIGFSNYGSTRPSTSGWATPAGSIGRDFASHHPSTSGWATPAEYIAQEPASNNSTLLRTEPKLARPKLELTQEAVETLNKDTDQKETKFDVREGQPQEPVQNHGPEQDVLGKSEPLTPVFSPEEIIARIPALMRPSTSTFMSLGSSSSMLPVGKGARSPSLKLNSLRRGLSSSSLKKTVSSKQSSKNSLFRHASMREYTAIDSTSSFYPSQDGSRCQSLQQSLVDIQATIGDAGFQMIPMNGRFSREFSDRPPFSPQASQTPSEAGKSPAFSKFNFPWNSNFSRSGQSVDRTITELVNDRTPPRRLQESIPNKFSEWKDKTEKKDNTSPRAPGRFGFLRKSTNIDSVSDLHSPESSETGATTITPEMYGGRSSVDQQTNNSVKGRKNWAKAGPQKFVPNREGSLLKQGQTTKDKNAESRHVEDIAEKSQEEGRFDHINSGGIIRSKSMTLRKTFTASMAKIRDKVNITGGSKTSHQSKRPESAPRDPYHTQSMRDTKTRERSEIDFKTDSAQWKPRSMPNRRSFDVSGTSSGNSSAMLRRTSTVRSMPQATSRRPSAARILNRKKRNTVYDECVIFPFSEDGNDDEELVYGHTFLGVRDTNFQTEEYDSESRFLRELRKQTVASRADSISVATAT
ncbi:hypothetical protein EDC01DRAFT_631955 [Geopyxis carbonaria]|nr:hypothetical protein EDC01DRAFT_631955 [Geopyxis carbonaria]